jgi:succinate-semialdehyde dehydrogenase/glutarate-semialdehyde dehydrogenase
MRREEIGDMILRAREAQKLWAAMSYGKRAGHLKKAGKWLTAHGNEIIETIHRDSKKLPMDALSAELLPAVRALEYYRKQGKRFLAPRRIKGSSLLFNKKSCLVYKPYGVVGIISPWNYPFSIPFSGVIMALLAGNAVILKTASSTLNVGRLLAELFRAAKLPDGLFNYVELPGRVAGSTFIGGAVGIYGATAPGVDKLFFTGSTAVGRELMALAAPRLLPLVLELGGADGPSSWKTPTLTGLRRGWFGRPLQMPANLVEAPSVS